MLPEERFRVLVFVAAVASVYVAAAWLALRAAVQRSRGGTPLRGERGARRLVFALALTGIACAAYGKLIEPYWLDVVHVPVDSERWHGSPFRIVHFSDVHSDAFSRLEERLPAVMRAERPDLIVFTGDTINSVRGLLVWKRCLSEGALPQVLAAAPADSFRVLLHHYPDELPEASRLGVDLYLGGHTHGGQVALPLYGALVTLSKFGKRFEAGLYRVGSTWAYINRGIGMEGGAAPRVRFFARPEVTVIEVRGRSPQPNGRAR